MIETGRRQTIRFKKDSLHFPFAEYHTLSTRVATSVGASMPQNELAFKNCNTELIRGIESLQLRLGSLEF